MHKLPVLVICLSIAGSAGAARLADLDRCLGDTDTESRRGCLELKVEAGISPNTIQRLQSRASTQPLPVIELVDLLEAGNGSEGDPADRAALHDLRGAALTALERHEEAADAMQAAVSLDDGTIEMSWLLPDGNPAWTATLDPGSGRLERAARALGKAGKIEEARELMARALTLGAGGSAEEGWEALGGGVLPGREFGFLVAGRWRRLLPDLEIPYFRGGELSLSDSRGSVVVLDFWASWCPPCLVELPHLQELYEAQRENGLIAVAINNSDPMEVALDLAAELGLTMPIGAYDGESHAAFKIDKLPTLVVADRNGRIRARWDGYRDGLEIELATLVHELLAQTQELETPVAEVMLGEGRFSVEWIRQAGRPIETLASVPGGPDDPRILAGLSRSIGRFDRQGNRIGAVTIPAFVARLRQADIDGDGVDELIGFRPGRSNVGVLYTDGREHLLWEAPAPLLEIRLRPAEQEQPGELILGTIDGLYRADLAGETITAVEGFGEVSGLALVPGEAGSRLVVVGADHKVTWLDAAYQKLSEQVAPSAARALIPGAAAGVGLVPGSVTAGVVGRFIPGEEPLLAVGLSSGQLVVLDPATGQARFRARFDPIQALAVVDLEGDGIDELIVAGGRSLAMLRGRSVEGEMTGM